MNYVWWIIFIVNLYVFLSTIVKWHKINDSKTQNMFVGKLKSILYIDTYNDLSNILDVYNTSTLQRNINMFATSNIIFNDLFAKGDLEMFGSYGIFFHEHACAKHVFSKHIEKKYNIGDNYIRMRASAQCLKNWNKRHSIIKYYIESYILFEVEDVRDKNLKFLFPVPEKHYITSLQLGSTTYHDIRSYVHSYFKGIANDEFSSTKIRHHWIFSIRRTRIKDLHKNRREFYSHFIGRNIYINYVKI